MAITVIITSLSHAILMATHWSTGWAEYSVTQEGNALNGIIIRHHSKSHRNSNNGRIYLK